MKAVRIEIREVPYKTVLYWLSEGEAADVELQEELRLQFRYWKTNKYRPIVFESGNESLEEGLYLLLKYNYSLLVNTIKL